MKFPVLEDDNSHDHSRFQASSQWLVCLNITPFRLVAIYRRFLTA
jgi:hypothetical protein